MSNIAQILRKLLIRSSYRRNNTLQRNCLRTASMSSLGKDRETLNGLLNVLQKNPKRYQRIKFLAQLFREADYELRIAGGAVRDILGGKEPQDIDFATTARPEQTLELVKRHEDILRIIVTAAGQQHGTVAVKFKETDLDLKRIKFDRESTYNKSDLKNTGTGTVSKPEYDAESPYEITTLRCDNVTDGRHAVVEFVNDWKIDAERRDLTINAMFLTLDDGRLIDYFNGESNLKDGIVRFVGDADKRLKEDFLRILRYFRFWSRYGKHNQPDEETKKTISENLMGLDKISGERIWQEIKKTFSHLPCHQVAELMLDMKVFATVGFEDSNIQDYESYKSKALMELKSVEHNVIEYIRTVLSTELKSNPDNLSLKKTKDLMPIIMIAPIVTTSEMCIKAHGRMKFSNVERDSLLFIVENRETELVLKNLKHHLALSIFQERQQTLLRIRALLIYKGCLDMLKDLESWDVPTFPINGHIVAQEFKKQKLPPSQANKIKNIIDILKNFWADNDYRPSKEDLEKILVEKVAALKEGGLNS